MLRIRSACGSGHARVYAFHLIQFQPSIVISHRIDSIYYAVILGIDSLSLSLIHSGLQKGLDGVCAGRASVRRSDQAHIVDLVPFLRPFAGKSFATHFD